LHLASRGLLGSTVAGDYSELHAAAWLAAFGLMAGRNLIQAASVYDS
jgi:hypothetical protein